MTELKKVELSYEELKIAYEVREKSVIEIADTYGISDEDVKAALRAYGIKVKKSEPKRTTEKNYVVVYTTPNKLVKKEESVKIPDSKTSYSSIIVDFSLDETPEGISENEKKQFGSETVSRATTVNI